MFQFADETVFMSLKLLYFSHIELSPISEASSQSESPNPNHLQPNPNASLKIWTRVRLSDIVGLEYYTYHCPVSVLFSDHIMRLQNNREKRI